MKLTLCDAEVVEIKSINKINEQYVSIRPLYLYYSYITLRCTSPVCEEEDVLELKQNV